MVGEKGWHRENEKVRLDELDVLQGLLRDYVIFTINKPNPETAGAVVGTASNEAAPKQRMADDEWRVAARRRLRLRVEHGGTCGCGMTRDERGDRTFSCQRNPWRTGTHNRVRDELTQMFTALRRDELEWLDVTKRRSAATETVHAAGTKPGY